MKFQKSLSRARQVMAVRNCIVVAVSSSKQVLHTFSKVFQDGLGC